MRLLGHCCGSSMKVGDLICDSTYGMNGVIIDEMPHHEVIKRWPEAEADNLRVWMILYEDGQTNEAFDSENPLYNELEAIL